MKRISNNLPKDWTVKKLGDLGSFSKGSGITKDELVEVGIPCIRYGEIYAKSKN
jgi:type I restriction enzyme, S subunit